MIEKKAYTIRLSLPLAKRLDDEAYRLRRSRTNLLEIMVENCLDLLEFNEDSIMAVKK